MRDLAFDVVTEAGATNPYDAAKAIEAYLRENYEYSTQIEQPGQGVDRADWFLFENKKGYCEYYATAMVVMLRSLGIPSRMATGYAPGDYDSGTGNFTVKESSAHAWPEVYFPGYGWTEFEPTPSQTVIQRGEQTGLPGELPEPLPTASVAAPTSDPNDNERDPIKPTPGPRTQAAGSTSDDSGGPSLLLILGGLLLLLLMVMLLVFRPWRRGGMPGMASSYYSKMLAWARFLRIRPGSHQTPYEFTEALAREVPGTSLLARRITRAYVRERYAPPSTDLTERTGADSAWRSLWPRLLRYVPTRHLRLPRRDRRRQS